MIVFKHFLLAIYLQARYWIKSYNYLQVIYMYMCVKLDRHLVVVKLHSINIIIKELLSSKQFNCDKIWCKREMECVLIVE